MLDLLQVLRVNQPKEIAMVAGALLRGTVSALRNPPGASLVVQNIQCIIIGFMLHSVQTTTACHEGVMIQNELPQHCLDTLSRLRSDLAEIIKQKSEQK